MPLPVSLKHEYIFVRHGHSIPNERGVIVSALAHGCSPEYGLSAKGKVQVVATGKELKQFVVQRSGTKLENVYVLSSPFTRAKETAEAIAAELGVEQKNFSLVTDLRERYFGEKELMSDKEYAEVWAEDKKSASHTVFGVESVEQVWNRVSSIFRYCEKHVHTPSVIILVAHGDTIQISETAIRGMPLKDHRSIEHMNQAEWRRMTPKWNSRHASTKVRSKL